MGHVRSIDMMPERVDSALVYRRNLATCRFDTMFYAARPVVTISEYALIDLPTAWGGWRNPVRFTRLTGLGIDPGGLSFQQLQGVSIERPLQCQEQWQRKRITRASVDAELTGRGRPFARDPW